MSPRPENPSQPSQAYAPPPSVAAALDDEETDWSDPPSEPDERPSIHTTKPKVTFGDLNSGRHRRRHSTAYPGITRRGSTSDSAGYFGHQSPHAGAGGQVAHGGHNYQYPATANPFSPQPYPQTPFASNPPPPVHPHMNPNYPPPPSPFLPTQYPAHHQAHHQPHHPSDYPYPQTPYSPHGYPSNPPRVHPFQHQPPVHHADYEIEEMKRKVRFLESKAKKQEEKERWRAEEQLRRREEEAEERREKKRLVEKLRRDAERKAKSEAKRASAATAMRSEKGTKRVDDEVRAALRYMEAGQPNDSMFQGGNAGATDRLLMDLVEFVEQRRQQHATRSLYGGAVRGVAEEPKRSWSTVDGMQGDRSQHMINDVLRKQIEGVVIDVLERQSTVYGDQETAQPKPQQTTFAYPVSPVGTGQRQPRERQYDNSHNANIPLSPGASSNQTAVNPGGEYSSFESNAFDRQAQSPHISRSNTTGHPFTQKGDAWPLKVSRWNERTEQAAATAPAPAPHRTALGGHRRTRTEVDTGRVKRPSGYINTDGYDGNLSSDDSDDDDLFPTRSSRYAHQFEKGRGGDGRLPEVPDPPSRPHNR